MKKEVKVVEASKVIREGGKRPRVITKAREGSDKITFIIGTIKGGIDMVESYSSDLVHHMLEGKATIEWEGNKVELTDGMAVYIPAGTEYRYWAEKDHQLISVFSPAIV